MITPISIDVTSLNIPSLVPMSIAVIGALFILCLDLFVKNVKIFYYFVLVILFLLADLGVVISYNSESRGFFDVLLIDGIAILSQIIILIASCFFICVAMSKEMLYEYRYPEYFSLFLFMTAGLQFMVASDNLILIFVGLETASIALYTLIAMQGKNKAIEGAIKYFTMGALAAALFAFGSMIFYAVTGSIEIELISKYLSETNFENYEYILLGTVFMLAAIGFKLSLVPFHTWVPDVYEGSSTTLAGYIAVVPKIAIFVVAIRFFHIFISINDVWVEGILWAIAVLTMTIPNMIALLQNDVKRMLAYSSISHAGFVLVTIMLGTTQAFEALFFYWVLFSVVLLGTFGMLGLLKTKENYSFYGYRSDFQFDQFTGLVKKAPLSAFVLAILMFALAGIPPFSVFWGKLYLISTTINSNQILLAFIMILNSVIAVFYYLKLIIYMFLKVPQEMEQKVEFKQLQTRVTQIIIGLAVVFTITSIFWLELLLNYISIAVQSSGF